ncbi:MAG: hypothetical protein ABL967_06995 [Bryobacteraceae bacterium]
MRPKTERKRKPASPWFFPVFFACVIVLFCGIMVFSYVESKKANPVMLDERGQIRQESQ